MQRSVWSWRLAPAGLALAALLVAGCGGNFCEDAAECEGGNGKDIEACDVWLDSLDQLADVSDCGNRLETWLECMDEHARCTTDNNRNFYRAQRCDEPYQRLQSCVSGQGN